MLALCGGNLFDAMQELAPWSQPGDRDIAPADRVVTEADACCAAFATTEFQPESLPEPYLDTEIPDIWQRPPESADDVAEQRTTGDVDSMSVGGNGAEAGIADSWADAH